MFIFGNLKIKCLRNYKVFLDQLNKVCPTEKKMQVVVDCALQDKQMSRETISFIGVQCLSYCLSCTAVTAHENDSLMYQFSLNQDIEIYTRKKDFSV
jgi:hypothetical protein